jgi:hypothetical protein
VPDTNLPRTGSVFEEEVSRLRLCQAVELRRRQAEDVARGPGLDPGDLRCEDGAVDEDPRTTEWEAGDTGRAKVAAARRDRELATIERSFDGDERNERTAVALEPLSTERTVRRRVDTCRELFEATLDSGPAKLGRDALHGLRPHGMTIRGRSATDWRVSSF